METYQYVMMKVLHNVGLAGQARISRGFQVAQKPWLVHVDKLYFPVFFALKFIPRSAKLLMSVGRRGNISQARGWGGYRELSKPLRSVNSIASTKYKNNFLLCTERISRKAKKGQSFRARGFRATWKPREICTCFVTNLLTTLEPVCSPTHYAPAGLSDLVRLAVHGPTTFRQRVPFCSRKAQLVSDWLRSRSSFDLIFVQESLVIFLFHLQKHFYCLHLLLVHTKRCFSLANGCIAHFIIFTRGGVRVS